MAFTKILGPGIHTEADLEVDDIVAGIVTAESFIGDASQLTGLPSGLGTALSSDVDSPLNKIYYTNSVLSVGATITINHPSSAVAAYTQYADIVASGDADIIVEDGDDFIPDILGISTGGPAEPLAGGGGRIRADNITNKAGTGKPNFPNGLTGELTGNVTGNVTGDVTGNIVGTSATFSGNVSIGGTLTYDDVTNIDSVGLITARSGVRVTGGGLNVVGSSDLQDVTSIGINATGVVTATSFSGDGSSLTGISAGYWQSTDVGINTLSSVGIGTTNPTEKLHVLGDARVTGILTVGTASVTIDGANNRIGIESSSPRVAIDVSQATDGIALPVGTQAQRPTGVEGYMRFNSESKALEIYNGTNWVEIISDYFPSGSLILG